MLKLTKIISLLAILFFIAFIVNSCAKGSSGNTPVVHINCDSLFNDSITPADNVYVDIPNAFTPNGDGVHDMFVISGYSSMDSALLTIFDDNNNVVYRSQNKTQWGPGTSFPQGKYYYRLQLKTKTGKRVGKCGFVWVLRCMPSNMPDSLDYIGQGANTPYNVDPIRTVPCN